MSKWLPGNVVGSFTLVPKQNSYIVRFVDEPSKIFSIRQYKTLENAYEAARLYRRQYCIKHKLTKNDYRFVDGYVEFQLPGGYIGKVDIQDFPKLVYNWHVKKAFNRMYVQTSNKKDRSIKNIHNLIFPKWKEIDHINRDGLDNRRCNLRDGKKDNINVKNQSKRVDNSSGKTGVHFQAYNNTWKVQWPEGGKRLRKTFSVSKYGMEGAKQKAIQFRVDVDKRLGLNNGYDSDCDDKNKVYPETPAPEHKPELYRTNKSGIHGVINNGRSWVASWSVNGKRGNKSFSIATHGYEAAMEMAIQARLEARPELRQ